MVKTNVLYKSVRSEVKYDGGKEAEKDGQLTPIQTITFNIRYNKEIKEDMIIEYRTKFYNIRYIELKTGFSDRGPAWIGKVVFSKSGQTIYFNGLLCCR